MNAMDWTKIEPSTLIVSYATCSCQLIATSSFLTLFLSVVLGTKQKCRYNYIIHEFRHNPVILWYGSLIILRIIYCVAKLVCFKFIQLIENFVRIYLLGTVCLFSTSKNSHWHDYIRLLFTNNDQ